MKKYICRLAVILTLALLVCLIPGCGKEGEEKKDTLTVAFRNEPANMDPTGSSALTAFCIQFQNFDDAKDAADHLKNKKPVVANLEKLDNDTTRRVVDFLSGAVYGVAGRIQNVSNRIFLITPANVEVTGNYQDNIKGFPFVN